MALAAAFDLFRSQFGQAEIDMDHCVVQYIYTPINVTVSVGDLIPAVPNFKE